MKLRVGTRDRAFDRLEGRRIVESLRAARAEVEIRQETVPARPDEPAALEPALLDRRVDVIVCPLTVVPFQPGDGISILAVPARGCPWDGWVSNDYPDLLDLPPGSSIGVESGSPRRNAQVLHRFPHLKVLGFDIVSRAPSVAGVILTAEPLYRCGSGIEIRCVLGPTEMTPEPGQGALAILGREDDEVVRELVSAIDHASSRAAVFAERAFAHFFAPDFHRCPVGAIAQRSGDVISILGMVAAPDGSRLLRISTEGPASDPVAVGRDLAFRMRSAGADEILAARRDAGDPP